MEAHPRIANGSTFLVQDEGLLVQGTKADSQVGLHDFLPYNFIPLYLFMRIYICNKRSMAYRV